MKQEKRTKKEAYRIANNLFCQCMQESSKAVRTFHQKNQHYQEELDKLVMTKNYFWMNFIPELWIDLDGL